MIPSISSLTPVVSKMEHFVPPNGTVGEHFWIVCLPWGSYWQLVVCTQISLLSHTEHAQDGGKQSSYCVLLSVELGPCCLQGEHPQPWGDSTQHGDSCHAGQKLGNVA